MVACGDVGVTEMRVLPAAAPIGAFALCNQVISEDFGKVDAVLVLHLASERVIAVMKSNEMARSATTILRNDGVW